MSKASALPNMNPDRIGWGRQGVRHRREIVIHFRLAAGTGKKVGHEATHDRRNLELSRLSGIVEQAMDMLVNIDVDDLSKAIAFYRRAAGLRIGRRFGSFGAEMLGASSPIYLIVKRAGSSPSTRTNELRRYERHWTPIHLDFVVSDLESAVRQAIEAGAAIESEIETHKWGRIAYLADPFGHGICFIEFQGRGYDEIVDEL
jgi:predicted enzyme related to lactoylglutathione lyase